MQQRDPRAAALRSERVEILDAPQQLDAALAQRRTQHAVLGQEDGLELSSAQALGGRRGQHPAHGYFLPSSSCASATTRSGSKPNFCWSAFSGAEAPKVCMPITRPSEPT